MNCHVYGLVWFDFRNAIITVDVLVCFSAAMCAEAGESTAW